MADEEVEIVITARVDSTEVTDFKDAMGQFSDLAGIDLDVKVNREQLDETDGEIKDLDGSEANVDINADPSKAKESVEEVKEEASEETEMPVDADTEEAKNTVDDFKSEVESDPPQMPIDADNEPAKEKTQEIEEEVTNSNPVMKIDADASAVQDVLEGIAGAEIGKFGLDTLERAGRVQDSWNRLELTFANTGVTVDSLRPKITQLTEATGKSGSAVREWFNTMGNVGITNTALLSDMFENMAGRAYRTGTTVENLEASIQRMALSGNAGARMLTRMGISSYQLAEAMGVTNEEYVKAFKAMTVEQRLEALNKAMGDGTKANEMYKHSWEGLKERASIAFGSLLVQIGKPVLESITPIVEKGVELLKQMSDGYKKLPPVIQQVIGAILAGSVAIGAVAGTLGVFSRITMGMGTSITNLVRTVSKLPMVGKYFTKFSTQLQTVFGASESVGKTGAKGKDVAKGMKTTSVSLKSIGAGVKSMIAPLLEIAIVIAIMIPIVTLLVAEMLVCAKGLQMLISALDFGSIDLSSGIKGLKQLGQALWELTVIMGEMTLLSALNSLFAVFHGLAFVFNGLQDPVTRAVEESKKAFKAINGLAGFKIDEKIPDNLKKLTESLRALDEALMSLNTIILTGFGKNLITLGGLLGNVNTALDQGIGELKKAVKSINSLNIENIDESKVEKLKQLTESLVNINKALGSLTDIQWTENVTQWWIPGDTLDALEASKEDLAKASRVLSSITGLADIPDGTGEKLKKLADSVKSISDALKSLSNIDWEVNIKGFNPFKQLIPSLVSAKSDIEEASRQILSLNSIATIPDSTSQKLEKFKNTVSNVNKALGALNDVDWTVNMAGAGNPLKNLVNSFETAKNDITNVSEKIKQLGSIATIPDSTPQKLEKLATTANKVNDALKAFNNVSKTQVDFETVKSIFSNAKDGINKIALDLQGLNNVQSIDDSAVQKLESLKKSVENIIDTIKKINEVNALEINFDNITSIIDNSKETINNLSKKIGELQVSDIGEGTVESLKKLAETVASITDILNKLSSIESSQMDFGKLEQVITDSLGTIKKLADKIKEQLTNIEIDEGLAENVKRLADTLNSVVNIINSLNGLVAQEIDYTNISNIIDKSLEAVKKLATGLDGFKEINVDESIPQKIKTVADTANEVVNVISNISNLASQEIDYGSINSNVEKSLEAVKKLANGLMGFNEISVDEGLGTKIQTIHDGAKSVIDAINTMNGLVGQDIDFTALSTQFDNAKTAISNIGNKLAELNRIEFSESPADKINLIKDASQRTIDAINAMIGIQGITDDYTALSDTFTKAVGAIKTVSTELNNFGLEDLSGLTTATSNLQTLGPGIQSLINVATLLAGFTGWESFNPETVKTAVTNIKTIATELSSLSEMTVTDYSSALTMLNDTLVAMQNTLSSASGGFTVPAQSIGESIVNGIKTGLGGLDSAVRSKITQAQSSNTSTAENAGKTLGSKLTSGFKSDLKLSDAMNTEMNNVNTAIQRGVDSAKVVAKQGAQAIVQAFKNGLQVGSPGEMYWTMYGEMEYIRKMLPNYMTTFTHMSNDLGRAFGENFDPSTDIDSNGNSIHSTLNDNKNNNSPVINIYIEGDINDEKTMDKLVDRLTRALTWSNATGNRSV